MSEEVSQERLLEAARQAARTCLGAGPDDVAAIVYDSSTVDIGTALEQAFAELSVPVSLIDLDALGQRPLPVAPRPLTDALARSTVSALAIAAMQGEFTLRRAVLEGLLQTQRRHAHMPSITPALFADGLAMDYSQVAAFVSKVAGRLRTARHACLTSRAGTDLSIALGDPPELEILDGLIQPGTWQNLPSGQVTTQPVDTRGVLVVDRSLGDWFQHKYDAATCPVRFELEGGHVRSVTCDNARLERDLRLFLTSSTNSTRVSELAVGANRLLRGDHHRSLFEAYREGASLTLGTVVGTTAWASTTTLQLIGSELSLSLDGQPLLVDGRFVDDLS